MRLGRLRFAAPVTHVYNPLAYAWEPHRIYLERYGTLGAGCLLVGMNPGPWGMAQTGVPFGDAQMTRDWLGIRGPVARPSREHPKRPVLGFACHRREVSGQRFWGWARARFETPERFFHHFFVTNYCPLLFLEKSGRNRTPDKLHAAERKRLYRPCDEALRATVEWLRPRFVFGLGRFAAARIRNAITDPAVTLGWLPHPSPAHPPNNQGGWAERMDRALAESSPY